MISIAEKKLKFSFHIVPYLSRTDFKGYDFAKVDEIWEEVMKGSGKEKKERVFRFLACSVV